MTTARPDQVLTTAGALQSSSGEEGRPYRSGRAIRSSHGAPPLLTDPWPAPVAAGPVSARVRVPGSKSLANRSLILAALADGPSRVSGLPTGSRDLALMSAALRRLGAGIEELTDECQVTPGTVTGSASVDCGLAGTVMRFVPPVAALTTAEVRFDGDPRARERPMGPMLSALRSLGVDIAAASRSLPFTVSGHGSVPGGEVTVDASGSSQFITALLLSAARFRRGARVRHRGAPLPSQPHIEMTVGMLREQGVEVAVDTADRRAASWTVAPGRIRPRDRTIEPDLSNAAPFIALAIVTAGEVLIEDWPTASLQPEAPMIEVFTGLGASFTKSPDGMVVHGTGRVNGLSADLRDLGELVPTITAVCALADGPSHLSGIGHIAGHETDRLAALAAQIDAAGGDVSVGQDSLHIRPRPLHGGSWHTYHDHRMATCAAIVGSVTPGTTIENVATTAKTFPDFPAVWRDAVGSAGPETTGSPADPTDGGS